MPFFTHTPASVFRNLSHPPRPRARASRRIGFAVLALAAAVIGRADATWRLDNLTRIDGHAVTVVGAPRVEDAAGAKTLVFDGGHDGIFVPAIPISGARAFTIEVLFSPAEGGNEAQRFFHVQDTEGKRALMEIRTNGHGGWWLDTFINTNPNGGDRGLTLIDPKNVHPTNQWYWVALRYDGKQMADFVNGVKELQGERAFTPIGDGKISIGVRQNLVYWFKGAIREVRFHREALSEDKLQRVK
jgi:hypothetical protein